LFGSSAGLSNQTALVGAWYADITRGAAYLFRNLDSASGTVTQHVRLLSSDRVESDFFGASLSLSGFNGLIAAPGKDNYSGTAYLFRNLDTASGTITEKVKLTASDRARDDNFGSSVSLLGNNGLVGAHAKDEWRGAAYLYRNLATASGTITQNVKLTASDAKAGDCFGWCASLSGNAGLVGASEKDIDRGAAYFFRGLDTASGTITQNVKLLASERQDYDYFGVSASLSGSTGLVGARNKDSIRGAAYLFRNLDTASGTVTQNLKLIASDREEGDGFGHSVSLSGNTALVGAHWKNSSRGAAYLFLKLGSSSGTITENVKLTASAAKNSDSFSSTIALEGDRFLSSHTGKVHSGRVSAFTILNEEGGATRATDGLSFVSQEDWVIGQTTDGNRNTLSAGDTGFISGSGMAVYVGRSAGSDNNLLTVNGALNTIAVGVGTEGNTGNLLRLNGTLATAGEVAVAAGSGIGGTGTLTGSLKLAAGAFLEFTATSPLKVYGSVTLDPGFGVVHLRGLDSSVAEGTYPLIGGAVTDFNAPGIANWGAENAHALGGGKSAWFTRENNGLQLVVAATGGGELPVLNLSRADGQLTLTWTTSLSGLLLETSTALTGTWQTAGPAPVQNGNDFTVTLPLSGSRAFYRLRKP
jgi:hypothetical protein